MKRVLPGAIDAAAGGRCFQRGNRTGCRTWSLPLGKSGPRIANPGTVAQIIGLRVPNRAGGLLRCARNDRSRQAVIDRTRQAVVARSAATRQSQSPGQGESRIVQGDYFAALAMTRICRPSLTGPGGPSLRGAQRRGNLYRPDRARRPAMTVVGKRRLALTSALPVLRRDFP